MTVGARVFRAYTMMKKLILLAFIVVSCEAMAQEDVQCVPERAAMVDTIRAYARFEARCVLTARHIGARPGSYGANRTPSVRTRAFLFGRIHGRAGCHWPQSDNVAAVHSRTHDPSGCAQVRQ